MNKKNREQPKRQVLADNRRARFDYHLDDPIEAGLQLLGTEVKSLRVNTASLAEAYAGPNGNEIFIYNLHIPGYLDSDRNQHEPRRPRRLLMHRREINRLLAGVQREGMTIVPTKLYFNDRGIAKLELALGKGKKIHDKRETIKKRDWGREKSRLMKNLG